MSRARATASANLALVKYWGKADPLLNTPARGSLSLTLAALSTETVVELAEQQEDSLVLNGRARSGAELARVQAFLDLVRATAGSRAHARVESTSRFPVAGGLASSASGFAALAVAAAGAYGLVLSPRELSVLARRGSGSAARSIFGGFVRMYAGQRPDGQDAYAEPLSGVSLELGAVVALADAQEKEVGSTDGMEHTRTTSPYHPAWLELVDRDLTLAERALRAGDVEALAAVVEGNCLAMHGDALAARPGILYFGPSTLWAIQQVRALRRQGVPVFFTIDAGPHLVALCPPEQLPRVESSLAGGPGVRALLSSRVGEGARLLP